MTTADATLTRTPESDRYAIHSAKTEMREGYNDGDPDRILRVHSAQFTDLTDGHPSFAREEAHAALRARLDNLFAAYTTRFAPITIGVTLLGDTALSYGWHDLTLTPKSGAEPVQHRRTRFLEVWRLEPDRAWRILLTIDNADPPSAFLEDYIARLRSADLMP